MEMKQFFGVCNNKNDRHIISDHVNLNFSITDAEILNSIVDHDSKKLFQMIPKPKVSPFDNNIEPIISEYGEALRDLCLTFRKNEPISHRKAFSAVGKGIKHVKAENFRLNILEKVREFLLVKTLIHPNVKDFQYENSVWAVASLCRDIRSFNNYTFYRLIKYYNPFLKREIVFTAEIDAFICGGIPVEIKSVYEPKYLKFSKTRDDILKNYDKSRKVYTALQCLRSGVNHVILLYHDCKHMRIVHFTLAQFMAGVESEVKAKQKKEDRKFAKVVQKYEADMKKHSWYYNKTI